MRPNGPEPLAQYCFIKTWINTHRIVYIYTRNVITGPQSLHLYLVCVRNQFPPTGNFYWSGSSIGGLLFSLIISRRAFNFVKFLALSIVCIDLTRRISDRNLLFVVFPVSCIGIRFQGSWVCFRRWDFESC